MSGYVHDYGHDGNAWVGRRLKAEGLAKWLWHNGVPADAAEPADAKQRNAVAKHAGVRPPSEESWADALTLLRQKEEWAAAHPGDPRSARDHQQPNPDCCDCDRLTCALDTTGNSCQRGHGCAWCLYGCPAGDGPNCCQRGTALPPGAIVCGPGPVTAGDAALVRGFADALSRQGP